MAVCFTVGEIPAHGEDKFLFFAAFLYFPVHLITAKGESHLLNRTCLQRKQAASADQNFCRIRQLLVVHQRNRYINMLTYLFFHKRISRSSARRQSQICGTLFYCTGKRGRWQLSCLFLHIRDQFLLQCAQLLLSLFCCCCQDHNQIEIREHNAELTVRTICAEGARITAHPALIAVALRPVFYVAFRIALRLNLLAAGAFKPVFSKQLFSFPLALSGQKIREFCHILRHHLHTASTELRSVSEQRTGKGCDAKRLQQTGFQKLCDVLSRFFPQNGSQHVSSGCIVFIKRSRFMEHRMMKKGGNPVFGIVHNLRLVTTTHNQQMMQRDFFEIFGWIFRQQVRKDIDNFLIQR